MDKLEQFKQQNLRACQLKQLDILLAIDSICKANNIEYWLDGGTLLGAVRHGGFIPWDDDIDIAMKKEDLDRFIEIAPKQLPSHLFLQTPQNEPTKEPIVKVRDENSIYIEGSDDFSAEYHKGLYVDIFPFIDYPSVSRKFVKKVVKGISTCYSILHHSHYYSWRSAAELFWFGGKYCLYKALWKSAQMLFPHKSHYSNIPINNGYGIMHRNDETWPLGTIEFEGRTFPAPKNVDAYLSDLYRNYMDVPPPEKRKIHAVFVLPELIKD